jgi:hypothetical protein
MRRNEVLKDLTQFQSYVEHIDMTFNQYLSKFYFLTIKRLIIYSQAGCIPNLLSDKIRAHS